MKSSSLILSLMLCCIASDLKGQAASRSTDLTISLRGRRQTGNLNQLVLNPSASVTFHGASITSIEGNYDFLRVNGNQVVSDLWVSGYYQSNTDRSLYLMARSFYGFAKSYRIDRSIIGGLGIGSNLIQSNKQQYLQINGFAGMMDIVYDEASAHSAPAFGSLFKSKLPLFQEKLSLIWQLDSYHSLQDGGFWGFNNRVQLLFPILKKISLNMSHTTIFNNIVSNTIQRTNTLMLFGISYHNN